MKIGDLCTYASKSSIKAGEAINNGKYMFFTSGTDENKRYSDYQLDCEAIIMGTGGNATLHYYNGKFSTSTDCVVLIPNEYIRCKYLYYFFLYNINVLENGFKGAGLKHTNKNYISNIEINNVPNIETQDKIIKALNMVFGIKFYYQQQLQKLDELVKSRFIEMFGDPVSNPHGYEKVNLSELADIKIGPFGSLLHKEDYIEGGHPLLNPSHIIDGKIAPDNKFSISNEKYDELSAYQLHIGDVVMGRRGEMGRCAVIPDEGYLCGTGSLLIRTKGEVTADYIQKVISFPSFRKTIDDMAVGQTMPNLNVPIVSTFQIIIPPIMVQKRFYAFVEQVDKSKFAVQQTLDKAQELFDSLMQKYFG